MKVEQPGLKIERRIEGLPYPVWWEHIKENNRLHLYRMREDGSTRAYGSVGLDDANGFIALSGPYEKRVTYANLVDAMDATEAEAVRLYDAAMSRDDREEKIVASRMPDVEKEMNKRRA